LPAPKNAREAKLLREIHIREERALAYSLAFLKSLKPRGS
jgi:hypothetical protein